MDANQVLMLVWIAPLMVVIATLALGAIGVVRLGRQAAELRRLRQDLDKIGAQLQQMRHLGDVFTRQIYESQAIETVLGNVLIDKGVLEEQELEDAHQRLIIEPALLDGEHESLVAELADPASFRARMIRNLPDTLQ